VTGIDFSREMIARARHQAEQLGLSVTFEAADLRDCRVAPGSLGGVVFTYEVYSFLPTARERIDLLRAMASWLEPGGRIFLSARRLLSFYEALVLSIQWLRGGVWRRGSWGDSHTRWIAPDGSLRRSFIHIFPERRLKRELLEAGLRVGDFQGGHWSLSPMESSSTRT
jgi:SAM-dependent methyltransferase